MVNTINKALFIRGGSFGGGTLDSHDQVIIQVFGNKW